MSIYHIAASPADILIGGYQWDTQRGFDRNRVSGAFRIGDGQLFQIDHAVPTGNVMWYHYRLYFDDAPIITKMMVIYDEAENRIAEVSFSGGQEQTYAVGDTTVSSPDRNASNDAWYTYDFRVEVVGGNINVTHYINGAVIATLTAVNTQGKGKPARIVVSSSDTNTARPFISEIIIADEDTRGMRLRELRPVSFGIFKQWDGNVQSLRDDDLATGLTTATADARVSFGVDNLQSIRAEDIINRLVFQSYAQRGVTGLTRMNHFMRFANGTVADGSDIALNVQGTWHREEFLTNPVTGVDWEPEDFASIQTGVRART